MTCASVSKHPQITLIEIYIWTNVHVCLFFCFLFVFLLEEKLSCV